MELVDGGPKFTAKLQEPVLAEDPTSNQQSEQLPTYNAYSIDGDVTAGLVYVNYGLREDYETLQRLGVSVAGKIVLARYGQSWRGIKPKLAAEHGAVGCLIYSDPRDDGYFVDESYPGGPMRPRDGVQRGSVMDFPSSSPGDPLTPGVGATPDAKRLPIAEAKSLTRIPVLPISYADAQPLLAALSGPMAPPAWRGALPIPYHVGPGPATVHLQVAFNWDLKPVHDVIARISGSDQADQWVLRGNHHDGWVTGAADPVSALVAMLEEARAIGALLKEGWRPKRTIVYAAWDGEEPMLLGSTEWAETHAEELDRHAVAYVNTDGNGRGYLEAAGSHSLEALVNAVARQLPDPESKGSVWERWLAERVLLAPTPEARQEVRQRANLRIDPLGSGSDYTAFLDHLGIATVNLGFGGEDDGAGVYHSIYDTPYWYGHFADTDHAYGRVLAQAAGLTVMRLADAELLPFEFAGFADTMAGYVDELKKLLRLRREQAQERNRQIAEGVLLATVDPRRPTVAPPPDPLPPAVDFAPLDRATEALGRAAARYKDARAAIAGRPLPKAVLGEVNDALLRSERALTSAEGLPGRPWFRHLVYAPGTYTGYGARPLPGIREPIELKRYEGIDVEIARLARAFDSLTALLDRVSARLEAP
ncbi:MAG TPA: transferrin receptor-like dimerization domain-containing protein [Vicinamibacteria bacterium]|nr:transferrin receptor-like dimerization domain-containing protein [Vicinamibacteria bacterium]